MRTLKLLFILAAAGVAVASLTMVASKSQSSSRRLHRKGRPNEGDFDQLSDPIDDANDDSFPASDPPSWSAPQKDHLH